MDEQQGQRYGEVLGGGRHDADSDRDGAEFVSPAVRALGSGEELDLESMARLAASPLMSELYSSVQSGAMTPVEAKRRLKRFNRAAVESGLVRRGTGLSDNSALSVFGAEEDSEGLYDSSDVLDVDPEWAYEVRRFNRWRDRAGQRLKAWWCKSRIFFDGLSDLERARLQVWAGNGVGVLSGAMVLSGYVIQLRGDWQSVGWSTVGSLATVGAFARSHKLHKEIIKRDKLKAWKRELQEYNTRVAMGLEDPKYYELLPDDERARRLFICLRTLGINVLIRTMQDGFALRRYVLVITNDPATYIHGAVGVAELISRAADLEIALGSSRRPIISASGEEKGITVDLVLDKSERKVASFWKYIIEGKAKEVGGRDFVPDNRPRLPVGVNNFTGELQLLDLSNPDTAHMLIAGTTGSGKTHAMMNMVWALGVLYSGEVQAPENVGLKINAILLDPKKTMPALLCDYMPQVMHHLTDIEDMRRVLTELVESMMARNINMGNFSDVYSYNRAMAGTGLILPIYIIFADELTELCFDPVITQCLQKIGRMGRNTGYHIIANTQRPSADVIDTQLRSNFKARMMFQVASEYDSWIITGVEKDNRGRWLGGGGDEIAFLGNPEGERLVSLYFSEYDEAQETLEGLHELKEVLPIRTGWLNQSISERRRNLGLDDRSRSIDVQAEALADDAERQAEMKKLSAEVRHQMSVLYGIPEPIQEEVCEKLPQLLKGRDSYDVFNQYRLVREQTNPMSRTDFLEKREGMKAEKVAMSALHVLIMMYLDEWVKDLMDKDNESIVKFIWGDRIKYKEERNKLADFVQEAKSRVHKQLAEATGRDLGAPVEYEQGTQLHDGERLATAAELLQMDEVQLQHAEAQLQRAAESETPAVKEEPTAVVDKHQQRLDELLAQVNKEGYEATRKPLNARQMLAGMEALSVSKKPLETLPTRKLGELAESEAEKAIEAFSIEED